MRAVKRFANVNIAQPGDEPLIEKERLDGGAAAGKVTAQAGRVEVHRLRAEVRDRICLVKRFGRDQVHGAEPARVVERHPPPVVCLENQMVVGVKLGRIDTPFAAHSQMKHQRIAAVGRDQPEFAAPAERDDGGAGQPLAEIDWKRAAKFETARLDAGDSAAEKNLLKAADGGFDFGKFWHQRDMANVAAAS